MTIDYDKIDALNWSTLKLMDTSAAFAKHMFDHPEEAEDKAAFITGRAIHCAVLEPERFETEYFAQPDFGDMRTKIAKQAKAEWIMDIPDGAQIISQSDYDIAMRCADAIQNHGFARDILMGGIAEHVIQWETSGVKCKGRIDKLTDLVVDLKSTRRNTLRDVERDAAIFNYHAQLAWYHDGALKNELITGQRNPVAVFVHATPKSKFVDVAVLEMVGSTLEAGRVHYKRLLNRYIACKAKNWWPGMAERPVLWDLPEWMLLRDLEE